MLAMAIYQATVHRLPHGNRQQAGSYETLFQLKSGHRYAYLRLAMI